MAEIVSVVKITGSTGVPYVDITLTLGGNEDLTMVYRSESKNSTGYTQTLQGRDWPLVNPDKPNAYTVTIRDYNPAYGTNTYKAIFDSSTGGHYEPTMSVDVPYQDEVLIQNEARGRTLSLGIFGVLEYNVNRSMMHIVHDIPGRDGSSIVVPRKGGHMEMTLTLLIDTDGERYRATWEDFFSAPGYFWVRRPHSNQRDFKGIVKQWRLFHAPIQPTAAMFIPGEIRGAAFQAEVTIVVTDSWL